MNSTLITKEQYCWRTVLLFCFFYSCFTLQAQRQQPPPRLVLELAGGANTYQGELNQFAEKWDATASVSLRFQQWKRWHPGLTVSYGQAIGQDLEFTTSAENVFPNQTFQNTFLAVNADLQFNLIRTDQFKLYLSQGIGFLRMKLESAEGTDLVFSPDTRVPNETFNENLLYLPSSLGAAYSFENGVGIGSAIVLYNPQTAYLDNISQAGTSPNKNDNLLEVRFYVQIPLSFEQKKF